MMRYVKIGFVVILFIMLYLYGHKDAVADVPMNQLENAVVTGSGISVDTMTKGDDKQVRRFYNIAPEDVQYFLYVPSTVMSVDEILVIKAKSNEQAESLRDVVNSRLDSQKKSFEQYGTNQMGLLNNAVLEIKGNYLLFAVSEKASELKEQFENTIRK